MQIDFVGLTVTGPREKNEDAFVISEELGLCVLADGMGGHRGGDVASRIAIAAVEDVIAQARDVLCGRLLVHAVTVANSQIYLEANRDPEVAGMGTTVTALLFLPAHVAVAHVGDSRAYRLRSGELQQITTDHSAVQELVEAGFLSPEEALLHPLSNRITRSVGIEWSVDVDLHLLEHEPGDTWMLCSDGLLTVPPEEIRLALDAGNLVDAAESLVAEAVARGTNDNVTILLARQNTVDGGPHP